MKSYAARLDELPRPIWTALAIPGIPLLVAAGLAILAYLLWSRNMRCCGIGLGNRREDTNRQAQNSWHQTRTSGNEAFDEYRAATLRRLEEEQREFGGFMSRLRMARDKAEFDQFMAERRTRSGPLP